MGIGEGKRKDTLEEGTQTIHNAKLSHTKHLMYDLCNAWAREGKILVNSGTCLLEIVT